LRQSFVVSEVNWHNKDVWGIPSKTAKLPHQLLFRYIAKAPVFPPPSSPVSSTGSKQVFGQLPCTLHLPETMTPKMKVILFNC